MTGGRARALRGALGAGKCALGLHELSWSAPGPDLCVEAGTCERCGHATERTVHVFGEWGLAAPGACELLRTCSRCHEAERRVEHAWDPWEYEESARGPIRACRRCELRASPFPDQVVEQPEAGAPEEANAAVMAELMRMFEEQRADGTITPARALGLQPILRGLQQAFASDDPQAAAGQVQELMRQLSPALAHPSRPDRVPAPQAGSRAAKLTERLDALYAFVFAGEVASMNLAGESGEAAAGLAARLGEARNALAEWPPHTDLTALEHEALRPAMLDVRRFSLRHHLTFARPVWPSGKVSQAASAVFYSGGARVGRQFAAACDERRLRLLVPEHQAEPTSLRWRQLRECAVAVFDLTGQRAGLPLEEAAAVASTTYELGMALALGRPTLIVAEAAQALPFDIDIEPMRIAGGDEDAVAAALDDAVYGLQRTSAGSSVERSLAYVREQLADGSAGRAEVFDVFTPGVATDPLRARRLAEHALSYAHGDATQVILPSWPGSYPDAAAPRCFHVTPFGPAWAGPTRRAVAACCEPAVAYVRGDAVLAPDIIRSIWDEIGAATHLIIDLTGLNANVALELGIAHVLGRNVLLVSQDDRPERYFRAVAKYRCHRYALGDDGACEELVAVVDEFLQA